jgi:dihydropteroate synthase
LKLLKDWKNLKNSFLGIISDEPIPMEREAETTCANIIAILNGASIIRVHNVKNTVKSVKVLKKLMDLP